MEPMEVEEHQEVVDLLLVKLVRTVMKCFYEPKDLLVIELIIKEKYVSEQRFEEVLKFDVLLLRITLTALKDDKILGMKRKKFVSSTGKRYSKTYYFIKFGQVVNVVKFKLANVRNRLESLERELSKKYTFKCIHCCVKWTDMQAGELFNARFLKFQCLLCHKPVMEDTSEIPADIRDLVTKFNVQLDPLYDLLMEVEMRTK